MITDRSQTPNQGLMYQEEGNGPKVIYYIWHTCEFL